MQIYVFAKKFASQIYKNYSSNKKTALLIFLSKSERTVHNYMHLGKNM
jgi:hypothetical protein